MLSVVLGSELIIIKTKLVISIVTENCDTSTEVLFNDSNLFLKEVAGKDMISLGGNSFSVGRPAPDKPKNR